MANKITSSRLLFYTVSVIFPHKIYYFIPPKAWSYGVPFISPSFFMPAMPVSKPV
jgi:hypothetical protein